MYAAIVLLILGVMFYALGRWESVNASLQRSLKKLGIFFFTIGLALLLWQVSGVLFSTVVSFMAWLFVLSTTVLLLMLSVAVALVVYVWLKISKMLSRIKGE